MPAVPVSMVVQIYPKNKTDPPYPATIVGYAWITGLEVGGGPIIPPEIPDRPEIWPPPTPAHPICLPGMPCFPDEPPPDVPPDPPNVVKPPPADGGWAWGPNVGWIYVPGPGTPGPKSGRGR